MRPRLRLPLLPLRSRDQNLQVAGQWQEDLWLGSGRQGHRLRELQATSNNQQILISMFQVECLLKNYQTFNHHKSRDKVWINSNLFFLGIAIFFGWYYVYGLSFFKSGLAGSVSVTFFRQGRVQSWAQESPLKVEWILDWKTVHAWLSHCHLSNFLVNLELELC